jgi:hypothetical protein
MGRLKKFSTKVRNVTKVENTSDLADNGKKPRVTTKIINEA